MIPLMETPKRKRVFLFLLLAFLLVDRGAGNCPSDCSCKWKGGKQSVECVGRGLRTFPTPIDPGTQVLDLGGNSFETLPPDHFMQQDLINLQKIYLPRCRLSHINSRAFKGLTNLVDLDLSFNVLREVPSSAFLDCTGLMRLILNGNPIVGLGRNAFLGLDSLTTLELTSCLIETIEKGAFEGLSSLEWLKLNGNKLKRVYALGSLPLALKGISLEDNPWDCNCHLLELRLWLGERNVANSVEPRCVTPTRLVNSTLRDLSIENFACSPQLSPTTMFQKIGEGRNVSLLCRVSSIPESSLEWWFNGQPVSNSSLNILVEMSGSYPIFPPGSHPAVERKSELLILNATGEENGTFICLARNPGGTVSANFTVRVVSEMEFSSTSTLSENVTSLVANFPNLILILVSTLAVIGVVILSLTIFFLICKCSRVCRCRTGPRPPRSQRQDSQIQSKPLSLESKGAKDCGSLVNLSPPRMTRHPSESSTLTTNTKSNGSVFLLSASSDLGLADSNPDLIEGVRRADPDSCHVHSYIRTKQISPSTPEGLTMTTAIDPYSGYPIDYGLPKGGLNVGTLVRRSPSYPIPPPHNLPSDIPPSYDLAKYPKEYISPAQVPLGYYEYDAAGASFSSYCPPYSLNTYFPPPPPCTCGPAMNEGMGGMRTSSGLTAIPEQTSEEAKEEALHSLEQRGSRSSQTPTKSTLKRPAARPPSSVARLQRQYNGGVNESPDEGYGDECGEGTEI